MVIEEEISLPNISVKNNIVNLENKFWRVIVDTNEELNPKGMINKITGIEYANGDYLYQLNSVIRKPKYLSFEVYSLKDSTLEIIFLGILDSILISHKFILPKSKPYFEEQISLKNISYQPIEVSSLYFGFTRRFSGEEFNRYRFTVIPFRHQLLSPDYDPPLEPKPGIIIKGVEKEDDEYEEYSVADLFRKEGWYRLSWGQPKIRTSEFASEGWVWFDEVSKSSLTLIKYSQDGIEFSLIKPERNLSENSIHFGGAGIWHGDPEKASRLTPSEVIIFGLTHYEFVEGDWKKAYYTFRNFMDERDHRIPENYNPPIHWNELYDNKLWWTDDTPENRKKYYSLPQIEEEAEKAREIGCEAIYLDPGWDTSFGSTIWAEDRLLRCEEFVRLMRDNYNLKVSLHTPLAAWNDINAYPLEARRRDKDGNLLGSLCSGSSAYIETKIERLLRLAEAGVVYFMFDGSGFTGECYDENHGHSIPYTREEHCKSILRLIQNIHKKYPDVLIELHDPVVSGVPIRYVPIYYLHGLPYSFDEVWAFEYMWDPMDDLLSGRAKSLYYYNLAYSIPLYIHIDLRKDNENALMFWWYASTCRHLGVGGRHPNDKIWGTHKHAMKTYKRLKRFYTKGIFYGLDETIHVHVLPDEKAAVINVFNLTERPLKKEVKFDFSEIGFHRDSRICSANIEYLQDSNVSFGVFLPPLGTSVVEIKVS